MRRTQSTVLSCLILLLAGLMFVPQPAHAQQDNKQDLVQLVADKAAQGAPHYTESAIVIDKLMTFDVTPEVWQNLLQPQGESRANRNYIVAGAIAMAEYAKALGWGDLMGGGGEPSAMVDSFKGRLSATLIIREPLNREELAMSLWNFHFYLHCFWKFGIRPRSGRAFVVVVINKANPKPLSFSLRGDQYVFQIQPTSRVDPKEVYRCIQQGG